MSVSVKEEAIKTENKTDFLDSLDSKKTFLLLCSSLKDNFFIILLK